MATWTRYGTSTYTQTAHNTNTVYNTLTNTNSVTNSNTLTKTNTLTNSNTLTSTSTSTGTASNACYGTWAFCDNFENGTSKWAVKQGPVQNFSVVGDGSEVYRQNDASASQLYISQAQAEMTWIDSIVEANLKPLSFSSSSALVSLWGRYDTTWNADCGYYVGLRGDGQVLLGKRVVGVDSTIGSPVAVPGGISAGTWYDVKLDIQGTSLKAYVNGTQLLTQTDSSCTSGLVGVGSVGASFEADDVRVTAPATNSCVQDWRTTTCGAFCTYEATVQSDRVGCGAYLDCYATHGCSPETCGGQDDVCGVNRLNPWGTASKEVADQVYKCMGCAGSVDCANSKYYNGTVCADGNPCTWGDTCQNKVCVPDPNRNTQCSASDQCHDVGTCDTTTGMCSNPAKVNGSVCSDNDACTTNDACSGGSCVSGPPLTCDDGNVCTNDSCNPATGCVFTNNTAPCSDGNVCTQGDTCNSGACQSGAPTSCNPPIPPVTAPPQLPPPPDVRGCYVGTWNGWTSVPCTPYEQLPEGLQQKLYIGGGQVTIPGGYLDGGFNSYGPIPGIMSSSGLKFGQVATTFVDVVTDTSVSTYTETSTPFASGAFLPACNSTDSPTPNAVSIQANTNNFPAFTGDASLIGDDAWVQFAIQSRGYESYGSGFVVCIYNNDFTKGKAKYDDIPNAGAPTCAADSECELGRKCKGGKCLAPTYWSDCLGTTNYSVAPPSSYNLALQKRQFKPLDYATVAASAFTDKNDGQADLGVVAALSWFDPDPTTNKNDYRGLYAVVTKDRYGLGHSNNWKTITGTILGGGNCAMATFPKGTMIYTSVLAGNCATQGTPPSGVSSTVTWPGVCPNTLKISSVPAPSESTASLTDESNNLNIVAGSQSDLAYSSDGNNYLEMHYLASEDGNCVSTPRVYVKDHAQDYGSTPSNLGGQAYWESPDIIVVPHNTTTPVTPNTPAGDPVVIAGAQYDIYVRVHNDYACSPVNNVRARVWWGDATLATPTWTNVLTTGPDSSNPNWSGPINLSQTDHLNIIGPITWIAPGGVSPHECLLVNIQAEGEGAPTNADDAPGSYQVAQRNVEIGNDCSWTLKNGAQESQLSLSLTTTDLGGQSYLVGASDTVTVTLHDAGQSQYGSWQNNPHTGCTVGQDSQGNTVLTMNSGVGQATAKGPTLAASATMNVSSSVVPALYSGTTIDLQIATYLTNGGTITSPTNGATCSATAYTGTVPIP
jgi:hypothetical protein